MSLCRHYVRELRRSVLIGTPDPEKTGSKRSSQILENLGDLTHTPGPSGYFSEKEKSQDAQMSEFLRQEAAENGHSPHHSIASYTSTDLHHASTHERQPRPSFMSSPHDITTDSNSPSHTVARADIRASAEKILYTFLLPGAEREIHLPHSIVSYITTAIEEDGRDDPETFDRAKDYVFQAMERDAFPGFLRMKALGNLVPTSMTLRMIIGLTSLFGAFWTAFILIFLDRSRATRCWVRTFLALTLYKANNHRSSSHSQSASTSSCPTNMHWTQSLLSLGSVNTPSCPSLVSASLTSAHFSTSGLSWSLS